MQHPRLSGLLIAAGFSSRMGTFKPLLPLGEKTVIATAVESLRLGGIHDIKVVVGYQAEKICPSLTALDVCIIKNHNFAQGMFSSIVAGLRSFAAESDAFFLLPADIPLVSSSTIQALTESYCQTGAAVTYPVYNCQRGHPPLIDSCCFASILSATGEGGLHLILEHFKAQSRNVAVTDPGILLDMDTPEDYQQLIFLQRARTEELQEKG